MDSSSVTAAPEVFFCPTVPFTSVRNNWSQVPESGNGCLIKNKKVVACLVYDDDHICNPRHQDFYDTTRPNPTTKNSPTTWTKAVRHPTAQGALSIEEVGERGVRGGARRCGGLMEIGAERRWEPDQVSPHHKARLRDERPRARRNF